MLNTGGMRGRQKSLASKGSRLEEEELLLVFERDRALGLLCSLVFEGDIARNPGKKLQISGIEVRQERAQGRKRADCSAM